LNKLKLPKVFWGILFFLFFFFSNQLHSYNSEWHQLSSPPFIIYYQETNQRNLSHANYVLNSLISSFPQLTMNIGASAYDLVSVYITPTEDIYQQFVGKNFPDWSEGIASPSKNLVVLKSPDIMSEHADIGKIAIHELVHILLNKAVHGNPIPRWFNEGLAVYYSGEKAFASGSLISKALITKSIIDLTEIDDVLVFYQGKAQLAYQESYLAVLYLFEQFGKDKVKEIISELGKGVPIDQALLNIIEMDMLDFEYEWNQHIKKKYRYRFLVDFDTYLWILILALFLLGFVLMRLRNRQTIKRWENEDNDWTVSRSPWDPDETD